MRSRASVSIAPPSRLRLRSERRTPTESARASTPYRRSRQEKLASDVTILDMRGVCDFTDFFVIATGRNPRQTKAIYDEVAGTLKKEQRLTPLERGLARGNVDRRRLQRRSAAPLHARDAAVLPARRAVERRAVGRGRSARGLAALVVADRPDVVPSSGGASSTAVPESEGRSGRRGSRTPTPPAGGSSQGLAGAAGEELAHESDRTSESAWSPRLTPSPPSRCDDPG